MNKVDKCYKTLQQSSRGLSAIELAEELKLDRSTIYRYLGRLQRTGKAESRNGVWYAIQNNQNQNLNPIKTILDGLQNLTLKVAELKSEIQFIEDCNPNGINPELEIMELNIKIDELEKLKNYLISELKLSINT
jgi:DNA-binding transcriptional regulator YhcF (GntR family)